LSANSLAHAWALRRLAEAYPADRARSLPSLARWMLEAMVRDHAAELRSQTRLALESLQPVWGNLVARPGRAAPEELAWPEVATGVLESAEQIDRLTRGLFAGTAALQQSAEMAVLALQEKIGALDGLLVGFQSQAGLRLPPAGRRQARQSDQMEGRQ
jgi:hypothetical protein